jgi:CubicO group peptidase (beta-lactamase class C family)
MTGVYRDRKNKRSSSCGARRLALIFLSVALAGLAWTCRARENGRAAAIQKYLEAAQHAWNFQGAVLVARGEKVVFSGGFGFADAAGERRNTPSTKFSIGSVTKTFTAAAVLQLRDNGLVDLDAPVTDYVPEYTPKGSAGVTLRRLLSHSAGVPDIGLDPRSLGDLTKPRSPVDLIGMIGDKPLDFAPGESSRYSNTGYILLGLVIERASGMPYADYVHDRLLVPLGMSRTSYGGDVSSESGLARGLMEGPDGGFREAPLVHPSLGYSAGALFSTVEDMGRWARGLGSDRILTANSRAEMFKQEKDGFGLGWLIMDTWGRKDIAHGGGAPGYNAWIERWPEDGVFVAVLSNTGGSPVGEIGRSLAAILFGQDVQMPEARRAVTAGPASTGEYEGVYRINETSRREILREGNALFVRRDAGPRYPILPGGKDMFFFPNDKGATIRFVRDRTDRVSGHVFHQLGLDELAEKIETSTAK